MFFMFVGGEELVMFHFCLVLVHLGTADSRLHYHLSEATVT